ncbi:MAG: hypothetical protein ACT4P6_22055, partial [Gemmatimonadaceae bacterium]
MTESSAAATVSGEAALPHLTSGNIEGKSLGDRVYRGVTTVFAAAVPILLLLIAFEVMVAAWPAFQRFGLRFVTSSAWDPVRGDFGAAPMIFGTLVSSALALLIATP